MMMYQEILVSMLSLSWPSEEAETVVVQETRPLQHDADWAKPRCYNRNTSFIPHIFFLTAQVFLFPLRFARSNLKP